jgi:methylenetetrahydrofolate--tRNA-(uracil-5-)-methyltransferase
MGDGKKSFQPMNVNFGLFPDIDVPKPQDGKRLRGKEKTRARKRAMALRALADIETWLGGARQAAE